MLTLRAGLQVTSRQDVGDVFEDKWRSGGTFSEESAQQQLPKWLASCLQDSPMKKKVLLFLSILQRPAQSVLLPPAGGRLPLPGAPFQPLLILSSLGR